MQIQGRALITQGRIGDGLALLDEAMTCVLAGELAPLLDGRPTLYLGNNDFTRWVFAGVPVSTNYGEEPLRNTFPQAANDPLFYAQKGSDWSRPGDASFGVRAAASVPPVMHDTSRGAASRLPRKSTRVSTSDPAISGRATCSNVHASK